MDELFDWLTIIRTPGLSARRGQDLLARYGSPGAIREAGSADLSAAGLAAHSIEYLRTPDRTKLERDASLLDRRDTHLVTFGSADYPDLLTQIPDPPIALFVRGDKTSLHLPQLAIVGSRNPTQSGLETAFDFAQHLAGNGITITSGLALGIDTQCHLGALSDPDALGKTIAVMGTGIDAVYPVQQSGLANRIIEQGALVSEFPPDTVPKREHFPQRNRIISGLALGVLVVEAAQRSGSLITARHASEQGREVFAIPGSIHNPLTRGCHRLIRQGAKLVESAEDIFEELESLIGSLQRSVQTAANPDPSGAARHIFRQSQGDPDHARLLAALEFDAQPIDRIMQRTGLTADEVSSMLLILELEGKVVSAPGGQYARVRKRDSE